MKWPAIPALAVIFVLLAIVWLGHGIIVNLAYPDLASMGMPYECNPLEFTCPPCPPPNCTGAACIGCRTCTICPLINFVTVGLMALDLALLIVVLKPGKTK